MPTAAVTSSRIAEARFAAIGTTNRILVTRPEFLTEATLLAREHLADLDAAVSRFRPDSEVSSLCRLATDRPARVLASPMFADYLRAGLRAARLTDGLVDPSVGSALAASGYDADLDIVRRRPVPAPGVPVRPVPPRAAPAGVPGWRMIAVDDLDRVQVAPGTLIDLGASAKAAAADRIAADLADRLPGGFLVNLGGDIATSGELPPGGWLIGVEDAVGRIVQVVTGHGQAFATSSTQKRTWRSGDPDAPVSHHIVDPRTGRAAVTSWAQVTCAAATCLEANAAATAAVILGEAAPAWLAGNGIPARLDDQDGTHTTTPGWPTEGS